MAKLMVIAVPPEDHYPRVEDGLYRVYLGDLVLPGFLLGEFATEVEADAAVKRYSDHYNVRAVPIDGPWRRRALLTVIQGGLSADDRGMDRAVRNEAHATSTDRRSR